MGPHEAAQFHFLAAVVHDIAVFRGSLVVAAAVHQRAHWSSALCSKTLNENNSDH